jgi:hypothetical protein
VKYQKPSDYISTYWEAFQKHPKGNNNLNGKIFEYILATLCVRENILPLYMSAKVAFVPNVIYDLMSNSENGLDSMIHFYTGRWADILDIWCVMGKQYYDRFKYIYHPDYKSIFADNEYTEVAKMLDRRIFSVLSPFEHVYTSGDETEVKNWQYNTEDWNVYERRKNNNFNLK